jgi:protein-tyrosine kinase
VNQKTDAEMNVQMHVADSAGLTDSRANYRVSQLFSIDSEVGRSFASLAENLGSLGRSTGSVVVTGPEVGVGRTTVCLGLGAALAAAGKKVAIVDCNLERPELHR